MTNENEKGNYTGVKLGAAACRLTAECKHLLQQGFTSGGKNFTGGKNLTPLSSKIPFSQEIHLGAYINL